MTAFFAEMGKSAVWEQLDFISNLLWKQRNDDDDDEDDDEDYDGDDWVISHLFQHNLSHTESQGKMQCLSKALLMKFSCRNKKSTNTFWLKQAPLSWAMLAGLKFFNLCHAE